MMSYGRQNEADAVIAALNANTLAIREKTEQTALRREKSAATAYVRDFLGLPQPPPVGEKSANDQYQMLVSMFGSTLGEKLWRQASMGAKGDIGDPRVLFRGKAGPMTPADQLDDLLQTFVDEAAVIRDDPHLTPGERLDALVRASGHLLARLEGVNFSGKVLADDRPAAVKARDRYSDPAARYVADFIAQKAAGGSQKAQKAARGPQSAVSQYIQDLANLR